MKHALSQALVEVREAFQTWRSTRRRGEPIPDELWARAVALLPDHEVSSVCYQLHVSADRLRRRAGINGELSPNNTQRPSQTFLELPIGMLSASVHTPVVVRESGHTADGLSFEVHRADGSRLTIALASADWGRAEALLAAFLRA
jgi:hypothetical protein